MSQKIVGFTQEGATRLIHDIRSLSSMSRSASIGKERAANWGSNDGTKYPCGSDHALGYTYTFGEKGPELTIHGGFLPIRGYPVEQFIPSRTFILPVVSDPESFLHVHVVVVQRPPFGYYDGNLGAGLFPPTQRLRLLFSDGHDGFPGTKRRVPSGRNIAAGLRGPVLFFAKTNEDGIEIPYSPFGDNPTSEQFIDAYIKQEVEYAHNVEFLYTFVMVNGSIKQTIKHISPGLKTLSIPKDTELYLYRGTYEGVLRPGSYARVVEILPGVFQVSPSTSPYQLIVILQEQLPDPYAANRQYYIENFPLAHREDFCRVRIIDSQATLFEGDLSTGIGEFLVPLSLEGNSFVRITSMQLGQKVQTADDPGPERELAQFQIENLWKEIGGSQGRAMRICGKTITLPGLGLRMGNWLESGGHMLELAADFPLSSPFMQPPFAYCMNINTQGGGQTPYFEWVPLSSGQGGSGGINFTTGPSLVLTADAVPVLQLLGDGNEVKGFYFAGASQGVATRGWIDVDNWSIHIDNARSKLVLRGDDPEARGFYYADHVAGTELERFWVEIDEDKAGLKIIEEPVGDKTKHKLQLKLNEELFAIGQDGKLTLAEGELGDLIYHDGTKWVVGKATTISVVMAVRYNASLGRMQELRQSIKCMLEGQQNDIWTDMQGGTTVAGAGAVNTGSSVAHTHFT